MNIKQIKQEFKHKYADLPEHWLVDWLLFVIDKPTSFLITDSDYQLTDQENIQLSSGITKMQEGTPLAYLIGEQEFWSLPFKVNQHTLIPRADTEVLVETALEKIRLILAQQAIDPQQSHLQNNNIQTDSLNKDNLKTDSIEKNNKLLDLGTGSGCIAISLAHEIVTHPKVYGTWQVTAVDLSNEALKIAKHNAQLNDVSDIRFVQSSWFDAFTKVADKITDHASNKDVIAASKEDEKFNIIVSNPPYIDKNDEHLTQLIAEPLSALVADNHGLADIENIIEQARYHLTTAGFLLIEHGYEQAVQVQELFKLYGYNNIMTVQDYANNDRVTLARFDGIYNNISNLP